MKMIVCIYKEEDECQANELLRLANGYHYIGRESPIVCNDKRISRKHAIIAVHTYGAIIKSAHINPTFFKSSVGNTIQILKENDTLVLNNGDRFALIEDSVWFKVKIVHESPEQAVNDVTFSISYKRIHEKDACEIQKKRIKIEPPENIAEESVTITTSDINITEEPNYNEPTSDTPDLNDTFPNHLNDTLPDDVDEDTNIPIGNISNITVNINLPEQRDITVEPLGNTDFNTGIIRASSPVNNHEVKINAVVDVKKEPPESSSGEATLNLGDNNQNATNAMVDVKKEPPESNSGQTTLNLGDNNQNATNAVVNVKMEFSESSSGQATFNLGNNNQNADGDIKPEPPENNTNVPSSSTNNNPTSDPTLKRDKCWYGAQCYRKNSSHKETFSHPGDNDYDSDPNDNRPLCPYGVHCYRRNVLHRRQYRHQGRPAPRPNINLHVNVNNCPCCNPYNPYRKPGYESDPESDPGY